MAGLIAKKLEMTRVVKGDNFVPVTLLEVPRLVVVGKRTMENDGYTALILGIPQTEEVVVKEGAKSVNTSLCSQVQEFRVEAVDLEEYTLGQELNLDTLEGIETVTIIGFSK